MKRKALALNISEEGAGAEMCGHATLFNVWLKKWSET